MQFLFPGILWGLFLLIIPIIIHLFYFRRYKQVYFTNVHFLKELVEETASRNKLKNFLILLCRLLAIGLLVFAFSQPFFKTNNQETKTNKAVSIYIDNSWSMNAKSDEGILFAKSKKTATEIVQAYSEYDKFQVISNELSGRNLRFLSKDDAFTAIENINLGPTVNPLSTIIRKQQQSLNNLNNLGHEIYVISDFQKMIMDLKPSDIDSTFSINFIPIQNISENNATIDTAYFSSPVIIPNQVNSLIVKLSNYGSTDLDNLSLRYELNGQDIPLSNLSIRAGKTILDTIKINIQTSGWQNLILKIKDFPIQFDDTYYLSFKVDEEINVLVIHDQQESNELLLAINSLPFFKTTSLDIGNLNYSSLKNYRLIILSDIKNITSGLGSELNKAMSEGTNLLIFPASDLKDLDYQNLNTSLQFPNLISFSRLKKEVGTINLEEEIFQDVFSNPKANFKLPYTNGSYLIKGGHPHESILNYRDGTSYLSKYSYLQGVVYFCTSPINIEYNSLVKNAEILLPFLFKAAFSGIKKSNFNYTIGQNQVITWPIQKNIVLKDMTLKLSGPEEIIPSVQMAQNQLNIEVYDQINKSGIYELKNNELSLGFVAFNENRLESDLSIFSKSQLIDLLGDHIKLLDNDKINDFTSLIKESKEKHSYWWLLILGTLLFLFLESVLIRYWKTS